MNEDARTPEKIGQHDARTLVVDWVDGAKSLIDVRALRLACGCARCIDEWSGQPLLAPDSIPADVAPQSIQSVGRYAIQIHWSDGHDTGIYPFERLRKLSDQGVLDPLSESEAGAD
jgi:ATP-binding protein involved in chromosome partitioning